MQEQEKTKKAAWWTIRGYTTYIAFAHIAGNGQYHVSLNERVVTDDTRTMSTMYQCVFALTSKPRFTVLVTPVSIRGYLSLLKSEQSTNDICRKALPLRLRGGSNDPNRSGLMLGLVLPSCKVTA